MSDGDCVKSAGVHAAAQSSSAGSMASGGAGSRDSDVGGLIDDTEGRFVEGVSNGVLGMLLLFLVTTMPWLYSVWRSRSDAIAAIHPSQLVIVDQFRRLLARTLGGTDAAQGATAPSSGESELASSDSLTHEHDDQQMHVNGSSLHSWSRIDNIGDGSEDGSTQTREDEAVGSTSAGAAQPRVRQRNYNQDRTCPICFGPARYAVGTNCGHMFCCACITGYWRHAASPVQPIRCPVCRTEVSLLMPSFAEADPDESGWRDANAHLNDYNRRFSGEPRPLWDHIRDLPVLVPYLIRRLFSLDGLMWVFRVRILLCLVGIAIYVLSPLDIIPEAIFGLFGILDDIFVAFVLLLYATAAFRQVMANRE